MPLPIPDEVCESWLIPKEILGALISEPRNPGGFRPFTWYKNDGNDRTEIYYRDIPLKVRDDAARRLYQYLTQEQVDSLRSSGFFSERSTFIEAGPQNLGYAHPRVTRPGGVPSCVAFSSGKQHHILLPVADRLLALLLAIKTGTY